MRKWFFRVLGLFFAAGICWMLIGVTVNFSPKSPQQKLNEARSLWQAKGSKDYQMDVSFFGSFTIINAYRIIVHKNQVTEILGFPGFSTNADPTPLEPNKENLYQSSIYASAILPNLNEYTVDRLFDIASTKVENQPAPAVVALCSNNTPSPKISFNPEFGFIQSYDLGNCVKWDIGGGLMCPIVTDCAAAMSIRSLQILPPS